MELFEFTIKIYFLVFSKTWKEIMWKNSDSRLFSIFNYSSFSLWHQDTAVANESKQSRLIGPEALTDGPMNSVLTVLLSVTPISQDLLITFFVFLQKLGPKLGKCEIFVSPKLIFLNLPVNLFSRLLQICTWGKALKIR